MASEEESSCTLTCKGTPVSELRVIDIKRELDERGLSKSGSKTQLTERLKAQLLLEKLQQDAAQSSGDELEGKAPNMALQDDKAGQNEFVRQYLQQQQRNIEIQLEVKKQVEEERKRKSADESSADESNRKKDAKPSVAPAEPEVTSPKKFKDDQLNAPVKGVVRMPRASRKSSRHASKGENGQEEMRLKEHSRSSTPENESIRERTRSGSSSSDHSPTRETSRRGRKGRHPRGRSSRGAKRGGRAGKDRSSSPSSSPEETNPKRKRRSTNSVSSRSPSHSPQLPPEVGTRRSSRKSATASTPDQAPDADAEDEKEKARPQRKRWTRKSASQEQPAEKADGKKGDEIQASDTMVPNAANKDGKDDVTKEESAEKQKETADVLKEESTKNMNEESARRGESIEKQTSVKIAEDNSGQKITSSTSKEKPEDDGAETKAIESVAEEKKSQSQIESVREQDTTLDKAQVPPVSASKADANKGGSEQNQPQHPEAMEVKVSQEGKGTETITSEKAKESPKGSQIISQESKAPPSRLSRWRSSRNKSSTPPQNDESKAEDKTTSETGQSTESQAEISASLPVPEKSSNVQEDIPLPLPVESGDAPSKDQQETKQTPEGGGDKPNTANEEGLKQGDSSETKEKVDEHSKVETTNTVASSGPPKDEGNDRPSRGRQRRRSGSSSASSSRSSSSGSKSGDESKSSSSSSRSSSSSSSDSRSKSKKTGAAKKSLKSGVASQVRSDVSTGKKTAEVVQTREIEEGKSQTDKPETESAKARAQSPAEKSGPRCGSVTTQLLRLYQSQRFVT